MKKLFNSHPNTGYVAHLIFLVLFALAIALFAGGAIDLITVVAKVIGIGALIVFISGAVAGLYSQYYFNKNELVIAK